MLIYIVYINKKKMFQTFFENKSAKIFLVARCLNSCNCIYNTHHQTIGSNTQPNFITKCKCKYITKFITVNSRTKCKYVAK